MDEETPTPTEVIKLTNEELEALKRMLQWPEDLAAFDKSNKPTNLSEILGKFTPI